MRQRVKKLRRIVRYLEQRKQAQVLELRRASLLRAQSERSVEWIRKRREEHIERSVSALSGRLEPALLAGMDRDRTYFKRRLDEFEASLESAVGVEHATRRAVVEAAVNHRLWETVAERTAHQLKRCEESRSDRVSDDLALLKYRPNNGAS